MAENEGFQIDPELDFSSLSYSSDLSPMDPQLLFVEGEEQFAARLLALERASSTGTTEQIPPSAEIIYPNDEVGLNPAAVLTRLEPSNVVAEEPIFNNGASVIRHTRDVLNEPRIDYETYQQQQQSTAAACSFYAPESEPSTAAASSYVPEPEPEAMADAGQDQLPNPTEIVAETSIPNIITLDEFFNELLNSDNQSTNARTGFPLVWFIDPATAAALLGSQVSVGDASLQQNTLITLETGPSTSTERILGSPAGWTADPNNSTGLQEQLQFWATDEPEGVVPPSPPKTDQPNETVKTSRKRTAKSPDTKKPAPKKRTPKKANMKSPEEEREEYLEARQRNTESTRRSRDAKRDRMNAMLERIKELEKERVTLINGIRLYLEDNQRLTRELEMRRASLRDLQNN